jgi:hypothetical protein
MEALSLDSDLNRDHVAAAKLGRLRIMQIRPRNEQRRMPHAEEPRQGNVQAIARRVERQAIPIPRPTQQTRLPTIACAGRRFGRGVMFGQPTPTAEQGNEHDDAAPDADKEQHTRRD